MTESERHGFVGPILLLLSGPLIWFIHFSLIYGTAGFGRAFGLSPSEIQFVAWAGTLVAGVAIVVLLRRGRTARNLADRERRRELHKITRGLALLALLAVLLQFLVLVIMPA